MLNFFKQCSLKRSAWLFLALSCAILEGIALYFQYGMGLQPCVMCIYERIALLGVMFASLTAFLAPRVAPIRLLAIAFGLFSAVRGMMLAIKHTDYQLNPAPWNQCSPFLDFPETLPLDKWLPEFFSAGGDCGKISWEFLGLIMPQWLIVIFVIYAILFVFLAISQFKRTARSYRTLFH